MPIPKDVESVLPTVSVSTRTKVVVLGHSSYAEKKIAGKKKKRKPLHQLYCLVCREEDSWKEKEEEEKLLH